MLVSGLPWLNSTRNPLLASPLQHANPRPELIRSAFFAGASLPNALHQVDLSYLTQRVDQMVLERQFPHKAVNVLFQLVIVNKLTILWGA